MVTTYFEQMGDDIGCARNVEHKIIVTDSEPIKQRPYRVSPAVQNIIDAEVRRSKMLEKDIMEASTSSWFFPLLLVPKKDGTHRGCVDYRRLNKVTKKYAYPIPYISTILDKLRNAK